MKKISQDYKKGIVQVRVENLDDLWYLSQLVDIGDLISGKTLRKLKLGGEEDRKTKVVRKPVYIKIKAEKIELEELSLKILGTIEEGPEDIPRGEHHSFNIEPGTEIKIQKETWYGFQKDKLSEAFSSKIAKILIVVFDREEAYFAQMKKYGFEILSHIEGNVQKKDMDNAKTSNFYAEIISNLEEYDKRYKLDSIVIGSPAFWKEELAKNLNNDVLKKKIVMATCSSVNKSAINELLKRDEVKTVLASDRITKELRIVEDLLKAISIEKAAYGLKEVSNAVNAGAVEILLISDSSIKKAREKNLFEKLDTVMKNADQMKAKVHIISSKHEGGKKLEGLGGIGAILRYKL